MKRVASIIALLILFHSVNAQRYMTRTGYIGFYSHTPLEDIKADNNQVSSILDISTGDIVFQVLIRSFKFEKALMEEHFNENYLESEKYPRSSFTGKIIDPAAVDFTKTGTYKVSVEGELTLHNVTKKINVPGIIEVESEGIKASAKFNIATEDYNITIPSVVRDNIARTIEVTVNLKYTPTGNKE